MTDTNKALAQQLLCNCHVTPNTGDGCGKCTNCIAAAALRKADARIENLEASDNIHRDQAHLWKLAASDSAEALRKADAEIAVLKDKLGETGAHCIRLSRQIEALNEGYQGERNGRRN